MKDPVVLEPRGSGPVSVLIESDVSIAYLEAEDAPSGANGANVLDIVVEPIALRFCRFRSYALPKSSGELAPRVCPWAVGTVR